MSKNKPNSFRLLIDSWKLISKQPKIFGGIVALHVALIILLALNPSGQTSGLMSSLLMIVFSLAEIWLIRHAVAREKTTIKEAIYKGTAQLVPFTLITLLVSVQLIPFAAGAWVFATALTTGIATSLVEQALFLVALVLMTMLSWYWLSSTMLALYIVSLPELTPLTAWHKAKQLAKNKRVMLLGRTMVLLSVVGVLALGILAAIPQDWLFEYNFVAILLAVFAPFAHCYLYKLYRSLV